MKPAIWWGLRGEVSFYLSEHYDRSQPEADPAFLVRI